MWVQCNSTDSIEKIDLFNLQDRSLQFDIAYYLPKIVKDAFINRVSSNTSVMDSTFKDFMTREKHNDWVFALWELYGCHDQQHNFLVNFETEISCSEWPDCKIVLYMKENITQELIRLLKNIFTSFFNMWEKEHVGEYVHDLTFQKVKNKQYMVHIDFGSINPVVINDLLQYLNDNELKIDKIIIQ